MNQPVCKTDKNGDQFYIPQMVEKTLSENLNSKAVWAAISAGMGQFQLEEVFRLMDLPAVSQKIFKRTETLLGEVRNISYFFYVF
jgi:hypothetical protein